MAKRIVILGAGESGAGAAVLAKKQGFDTFVSDMSTIKDIYKNMLNERGIEWEAVSYTHLCHFRRRRTFQGNSKPAG